MRRALLIGLLAACDARREREPPPLLVDQMPPVDPARTIEATLAVGGMTCSGCEYNVSSALRLIPGVLSAEADHATGEARVRFDPGMTTLAQMAEAVRTAGYVVTEPAAKED